MRVFEIRSSDGIDDLYLADRPEPRPGPGEILVRLRASSLNYRDLMIVQNPVSRGISLPLIPNSDGAGEVVEVGPGVDRFKAGDRVAGTFSTLDLGPDHGASDGERARRGDRRRAGGIRGTASGRRGRGSGPSLI